MANVKYFFEFEGAAVELSAIRHNGSPYRPKAAHFSGLLPNGQRVTAERMIEYKSNPSRHKCDARCQTASGRNMACQCECGGKNHARLNCA